MNLNNETIVIDIHSVIGNVLVNIGNKRPIINEADFKFSLKNDVLDHDNVFVISKEEIIDAMEYCIDNGKCSVFELSSYLVYKLGRERARIYLHDMELAHFTKRAKDIEKEFEYGRHK